MAQNRYAAIIERIFYSKFKRGLTEIEFEREEMERFAKELSIAAPKNLGDLVYSFKYRATLPESIRREGREGHVWIIRPAGRSKYKFVLVPDRPFVPNENLTITKIPNATPGIVSNHALTDEQALLAKLRYNRLIDIFTGVTCYSLQNHLRTAIPQMGQVETDELYVGIDKRGTQYVLPVQAKSGKDKLNVVQIEQDMALCALKFPALTCRSVGAQFMQGEVIALFEFQQSNDGVRIATERHYKLVAPDEITKADLINYSKLTAD